jgi:ectoine hydroxylase-related dioxygenase (phytanoyl-CoA dioxygenase family)
MAARVPSRGLHRDDRPGRESPKEGGIMTLREFTPANELLDRPDDLRAQLDREGYLFFRGLLPRDEVLRVRRAVLECCRAAGWLVEGSDLMEGRADPSKACVEPEPAFLEVYREIQKLEAFHTFAHHPALLGLLETVLGEPALPHPNKIARLSFPGNVQHTTPAHQDFPFIQGTAETFTTWVPLGDYPREYGGLKVNAGSHTGGVHEHHISMGAGGMGIDERTIPDNWYSTDYRAGDVLLFHSMLIHQALPNLTPDRMRVSVDFRYQVRSQPIAESNLVAPHTGQLTWEDVYRGWASTELQYYWKKVDLAVSAYDTSYFANRDREAYEAAERGDPVARPALLRMAQRDPDPAKRAHAQRVLDELDRKLAEAAAGSR